jgi:nitrite reductase/ring-hydroxylating ferredoxin subunit
MAEVRILDLADAPVEGESKQVQFEHPVTDKIYTLGVYFAKGRYLAIIDLCKKCESSLAEGKLNDMYALCAREQHAWHIKTGLYKFDRTQSIPTYRVTVKDEGLYIEI